MAEERADHNFAHESYAPKTKQHAFNWDFEFLRAGYSLFQQDKVLHSPFVTWSNPVSKEMTIILPIEMI